MFLNIITNKIYVITDQILNEIKFEKFEFDILSYFINETEETFRCIVLYEENITKISSRIRAKIKEMKLRNIDIKNDSDACELAYGFINNCINDGTKSNL